MKCCLCNQEIQPHPLSKWDKGNNAQPLAEGRCCDDCDQTKVIPERIKQYLEAQKNE